MSLIKAQYVWRPTVPQEELFQSKVAMFFKAQAAGRGQKNIMISNFFKSVYMETEAEWKTPEEEVADELRVIADKKAQRAAEDGAQSTSRKKKKAEGKAKAKIERKMVNLDFSPRVLPPETMSHDAWLEHRREKIHRWFYNEAQSRQKRKATIRIEVIPPAPRALSEPQTYSKMFYASKVKLKVEEEVKRRTEANEEIECMLALITEVTKTQWEQESEEVKAAVRERVQQMAEVRQNAARLLKEAMDDNAAQEDLSPEETHEFLLVLPELLRAFFDAVVKKSGWSFTLLAGGPDGSQKGGAIRTMSCHWGTTPQGQTFRDVLPTWHESYVAPFSGFLHLLYPPEKRATRELSDGDSGLLDLLISMNPGQAVEEAVETPSGKASEAKKTSAANRSPTDRAGISTPAVLPERTSVRVAPMESTVNAPGRLPTPSAPRDSPPSAGPSPTAPAQNPSSLRAGTVSGSTQTSVSLAPSHMPDQLGSTTSLGGVAGVGAAGGSSAESAVGVTAAGNALGEGVNSNVNSWEWSALQALMKESGPAAAYNPTSFLPQPGSLGATLHAQGVVDLQNSFTANGVAGLPGGSAGMAGSALPEVDFSGMDFTGLEFDFNALEVDIFPDLTGPAWQPTGAGIGNVAGQNGAGMPVGPNSDGAGVGGHMTVATSTSVLPSVPEAAGRGSAVGVGVAEVVAEENASANVVQAKGSAKRAKRVVEAEAEETVQTNISAPRKRARKLPSTQETPPWVPVALAYLELGIVDDSWAACLAAWALFEKSSAVFDSGSTRLPNAGHRPPAVAKWMARKKWTDLADHVDADALALEWLRWWNGMQPRWRQVEGGMALPRPLTGEENLSAMKKPGQSGLVCVLVGLKWWKEAKSSPVCWEAAVKDLTRLFEILAGR